MRVAGIDVGVSGALCLFEISETKARSKRIVDITDMPAIHEEKTREVDVLGLRGWLLNYAPDHVFLERVRAMPSIPNAKGFRRSMGATSAFNFGGSFASIKATVRICGYPFTMIEAQAWKRRFGLKGSDKEPSRQMVLKLMPSAAEYLTRKLDHNRAEAALIAFYGAERLLNERRVKAMMAA